MGTLNAICCIANDTENYRDIYLKLELDAVALSQAAAGFSR